MSISGLINPSYPSEKEPQYIPREILFFIFPSISNTSGSNTSKSPFSFPKLEKGTKCSDNFFSFCRTYS